MLMTPIYSIIVYLRIFKVTRIKYVKIQNFSVIELFLAFQFLIKFVRTGANGTHDQ